MEEREWDEEEEEIRVRVTEDSQTVEDLALEHLKEEERRFMRGLNFKE